MDEEFSQRRHLNYPSMTMFQMVERIAGQYPDEPAYEFFGRKTSYRAFILRIERAARAFQRAGTAASPAGKAICCGGTS